MKRKRSPPNGSVAPRNSLRAWLTSSPQTPLPPRKSRKQAEPEAAPRTASKSNTYPKLVHRTDSKINIDPQRKTNKINNDTQRKMNKVTTKIEVKQTNTSPTATTIKAAPPNKAADAVPRPATETDSAPTSETSSAESPNPVVPFWDESCRAMSQKLPWRVTIAPSDPRAIAWRTEFQRFGHEPWFTASLQTLATPDNISEPTTTCLPSPSTCLWQSLTEKDRENEALAEIKKQRRKAADEKRRLQKKAERDAEKKKEDDDGKTAVEEKEKPTPRKKAERKAIQAGKCRKIKVYLTEEQRETMRKWFGVATWTYNRCVDMFRSGQLLGTEQSWAKTLRAYCVNADAPMLADKPWVLDTPCRVREAAMLDLVQGLKQNLAKGGAFEMKYRSRKDRQRSITILAQDWGRKTGAYSQLFGRGVLRSSEPLPDDIVYDSRLVCNKLGHYYLCLPLPLQVQPVNQGPACKEAPMSGVIALDPGVRTFMTGYDPSGKVVEWGARDMSRIWRLNNAIDSLKSRWTKVKHHGRYRMKRAALRIHAKIRNLVDDLHRKLTKWLVTHYRVVLIPPFATQQMIRKGARCIGKKTVREMLAWSHYRFRMNLIAKTREHPWCRVVVVDEAYTSKTCGRCGHIHQNLGANKRFRCPACGFAVDRDLNGARNILIRYLKEREAGL